MTQGEGRYKENEGVERECGSLLSAYVVRKKQATVDHHEKHQ